MSANGNAVERPPRASTGLYVKAAPGLKLRDRKVTRLAVKVRAVLPWLEPADGPAVRAWCELEYLCSQTYAALRAFGVVNPRGEARRLLDDYRKLRQTQIVLSRELGMTPAARMAIKASGGRAPLDLAAAMANGDVEDVESEPAKSPQGG
jgi:phage terminase small subunit